MSFPERTACPRSIRLSLPLLFTALAACGPAADGGDAPDSGPDGADDESPLFMVHSATQTADGRTNYFSVVDSITEEATLDYEDSLEVPGRARLYAAEGIGFFAIGDSENITITRYELEDDGGLVEGATLSLQAQGLSTMGAQSVYFVDEEKAYYKDSSQLQIIVWNPTEMVVEDTIELPEDLIVADHVASLSDWAGREGEAFFAVGWTTTAYDQVLPGAALVRVDTETDEVTVTEDDRCRGLSTAANVDDTLYFFSGVINGFGHSVYPDEGGQQDCILRISPDGQTFDDDYLGSMAPALDGRIGTATAVTADGELWATVIDPEVAPTEPGTTYGEWYAEGWTWWHMPLDTLGGAEQVEGEAGAYSSLTVTAGSSFLISAAEADYSSSTLVDLSGGAPEAGLSFSGFALDVARVR